MSENYKVDFELTVKLLTTLLYLEFMDMTEYHKLLDERLHDYT